MTGRLGVCSVTFRDRSPGEIIDLTVRAGLDCIEWGGDVHVPPGDLDRAREVASRTADAGLAVASYGSYFVAGSSDPSERDAVLRTAEALGAPRVRVWAGREGSGTTSSADRAAIVNDLRALADSGATVGLEYHRDTLTDTAESTLRLLADVDRPSLRTYWQPPLDLASADAVRDLEAVLPAVCAIHAFSWWPGTTRLPFAERRDLWVAALAAAPELDVLLEFVVGDDPAQFLRDAGELVDLYGTIGGRARRDAHSKRRGRE